MEENSNSSQQTAERLRQFHQDSKRAPKGSLHSDTVLAGLAVVLAIVGVLGSMSLFTATSEIFVYSLLSIALGAFLYTVARIYTTLREIRDNQIK